MITTVFLRQVILSVNDILAVGGSTRNSEIEATVCLKMLYVNQWPIGYMGQLREKKLLGKNLVTLSVNYFPGNIDSIILFFFSRADPGRGRRGLGQQAWIGGGAPPRS